MIKNKNNAAPYPFAATQWDAEGWMEASERISDMVMDVDAGLSTLEQYELPRDLDTVKNFGEYADPIKWTRYIMHHYADYLGKLGFVPKSEKRRLRAEYKKVADETAPLIAGLARAIAGGCKLRVDDSGMVEADEEAMLNEAKPRFIRRIDTERMAAYWQKVEEAARAVRKLKDFEADNALPTTVNVMVHVTDPVSRRMVLGEMELDPKEFEREEWRNFVKSDNR